MKPQEQEKVRNDAEKVFQKLESKVSHSTREQNPYYRFCETVEKHIRATATDVFPQISNLDSEGLYKFRYLFVREIQQMYSNLEKMLKEHKAE